MNNTFNIKRFGLLLKRQWLEFGKIYLVSLLVALGVIIAFYALSLGPNLLQTEELDNNDLNFRGPLFFVFGFIFISIIASNYFAHLGQKPKAIIDLMIPASAFEKFLTGIFFTSILALASFLFLFYITDLVFVAKLKSLYANANTIIAPVNEGGKGVKSIDNIMYFFAKNNPNSFKPLYIVPFFITSIFLAGSVYFNRVHYIKTALSVIIFSGAWAAIIFKSGELLFKDKILIESNNMGSNHMVKPTVELLGVLLLLVLTLIFWSITYVRLKEKEV